MPRAAMCISTIFRRRISDVTEVGGLEAAAVLIVAVTFTGGVARQLLSSNDVGSFVDEIHYNRRAQILCVDFSQ
jgi:hypothetical protein